MFSHVSVILSTGGLVWEADTRSWQADAQWDGHCSRRYASCLHIFLLEIKIKIDKIHIAFKVLQMIIATMSSFTWSNN